MRTVCLISCPGHHKKTRSRENFVMLLDRSDSVFGLAKFLSLRAAFGCLRRYAACERCASSPVRGTIKKPARAGLFMVPRTGVEPVTCPLGGGRAIQLCHRGGSGRSIAPAVVVFESSHLDHIFQESKGTNLGLYAKTRPS